MVKEAYYIQFNFRSLILKHLLWIQRQKPSTVWTVGAVLQETRHPAGVPPRVSGLVGGAVPGEGGADSRPLHLPQTPVSIVQQVHLTHCDHTN